MSYSDVNIPGSLIGKSVKTVLLGSAIPGFRLLLCWDNTVLTAPEINNPVKPQPHHQATWKIEMLEQGAQVPGLPEK